MKIMDWLTTYGVIALQWYALYVVIAGGAFGVYLWYKIWRRDRHPAARKVKHPGVD